MKYVDYDFTYRSFWYWQWRSMWQAKLLHVIRLLVVLFTALSPLTSHAQNLYYQDKTSDGYVVMEVDTLNRRGQIYIVYSGDEPEYCDNVDCYYNLDYLSIYFEILRKDSYAAGKQYPYMDIVPLIYRYGDLRKSDVLGEVAESSTFGFSLAPPYERKGAYANTRVFFIYDFNANWSKLEGNSASLNDVYQLSTLYSTNALECVLSGYRIGRLPENLKRVRKIKWREFPPQFRDAIKADRERYLLNTQEGPLFIR